MLATSLQTNAEDGTTPTSDEATVTQQQSLPSEATSTVTVVDPSPSPTDVESTSNDSGSGGTGENPPATEPPATEPPTTQPTEVPPTPEETGTAAAESTAEPSAAPSTSPSPPPTETAAANSAAGVRANSSQAPGTPNPVAPKVAKSQAGGTGTITISVVDPSGNSLAGGACFQVWLDRGGGSISGSPVTGGCDGSDGTIDGVVHFSVPAGDYVVIQTEAHQGYLLGGRQTATVTAGQDTSLTFTNESGGVGVAVHKLDEHDQPLGGTCFQLLQNGGFVSSNCDGPQGGPYDGITYFFGMTAGTTYTVAEQAAPQGYQKAPNQEFTIPADQKPGTAFEVDVTDRPGASPSPSPSPGSGQGTLVIHKVDENGKPLPGACFLVYTNNQFVTNACDGADGSNDGTTTFILNAGDYTLNENRAPAGYLSGGRTGASVTAGKTTTVEITDQPGGVDVEVHKLDEHGNLLGGVCFQLLKQMQNGKLFINSLCDGPNGQPGNGIVIFSGIGPGDYVLNEQRAPEGYAKAPDQQLTVTEAEQGGPNVVVEVIDHPASSPTPTPTTPPSSPTPTEAPGTKTPVAPITPTQSSTHGHHPSATSSTSSVSALPNTGAGNQPGPSMVLLLFLAATGLLALTIGLTRRRHSR